MDERRMQRLVGMVVLFTVTFLGVLLVANNPATSPFRTGGYDITVRANRAPGVSVNTPVRKDGVLVGRVKDVTLTPEGVLLKVRIDSEDLKIYEFDKPQIEPSSILGDAKVSFVRNPDGQKIPPGDPVPLLAGSVIDARVIDDPITQFAELNQNLAPSIKKLGEAGDEVAILADKINTALGDDIGRQRIQKTLDELTVTLQDFRRTTNNFDRIISDDKLREELAQALREFPPLMAETRGTMQKAGESLEKFDRVIASAETNLKNIEGLTQPLGDQGEEIADLLISSVNNLDIIMSDLSRFANNLNNSEGTVGKLVNDPELYNRASLLIGNANVVVTRIYEFTKDLRPIVDDIRVFSDKIAREPGRIVGGAIRPSIQK